MKGILLVLGFLMPLVLGWGDAGHLIIARIAQMRLTQSNLTEYNKFAEIVSAFNNLTDGRSNTFVEASMWPDDIKDYSATLFEQYQRVNRVYDPNGTLAIMEDQDKDINVVYTIGWALNILKKNKDFVSFDRGFMARFLLSCVGDIHQPLNTIQMFNTTKAYLHGDKGGKLINITTENNTVVSLYDYVQAGAGLLQNPNTPLWKRPLDKESKESLDSLADSYTNMYPIQYFGQAANIIDPRIWAKQSYTHAIDSIYSTLTSTDKVSSEWSTKIYDLCKQRIVLAGYRLANVILSIYK